MVITFVVDMFGSTNNGTTVTCMRTAKVLRELGNEVRIIAHIPEVHDDLTGFKVLNCKMFKFPIFQPLIEKNGMTFATGDEKQIAEFIQGSDIVHLFTPFSLEIKVRRVANVLNIPVTSAFHVQPENVSYNINMGKIKAVNCLVFKIFNSMMYKHTKFVHTPSKMMRDQMMLHGYKNNIFPISNGVSEYFRPLSVPKPDDLQDKYVILMIGRLSREKRQDLIFKAIGHSQYNSQIQLILCGKGPMRKKYEKYSKKYLKNPCRFEFISQKELLDVINYSDLYIHSSDAESEAIACIEAFSCGKVPIISDSKVSATNSFALDSKCLFKNGDYQSLQNRIEYFIEHPEVKKELSPKYIEFSRQFSLKACVRQLEQMFILSISDYNREQEEHTVFFTSHHERRMLKKTAKKIGVSYQPPVLLKEKAI
ncbi:MAG: glycosyltransferase [Bacilli bacterium]